METTPIAMNNDADRQVGVLRRRQDEGPEIVGQQILLSATFGNYPLRRPRCPSRDIALLSVAAGG
jgi:hypothetical protein